MNNIWRNPGSNVTNKIENYFKTTENYNGRREKLNIDLCEIEVGSVNKKIQKFDMGNPACSMNATSEPLPRELNMKGHLLPQLIKISKIDKTQASLEVPNPGTSLDSVDEVDLLAVDVDLRRDKHIDQYTDNQYPKPRLSDDVFR